MMYVSEVGKWFERNGLEKESRQNERNEISAFLDSRDRGRTHSMHGRSRSQRNVHVRRVNAGICG